MPEEDKESKKMIQVGHDYQATVPEGFSHYGDAPAYENEDRLLWNPSKIDEEKCKLVLLTFYIFLMLSAFPFSASSSICHALQFCSSKDSDPCVWQCLNICCSLLFIWQTNLLLHLSPCPPLPPLSLSLSLSLSSLSVSFFSLSVSLLYSRYLYI